MKLKSVPDYLFLVLCFLVSVPLITFLLHFMWKPSLEKNKTEMLNLSETVLEECAAQNYLSADKNCEFLYSKSSYKKIINLNSQTSYSRGTFIYKTDDGNVQVNWNTNTDDGNVKIESVSLLNSVTDKK